MQLEGFEYWCHYSHLVVLSHNDIITDYNYVLKYWLIKIEHQAVAFFFSNGDDQYSLRASHLLSLKNNITVMKEEAQW